MSEKKKCLFSGTFDPPTLGHKAVIDTACKLFDEVIVAVMVNPDKKPFFTEKEREEIIKTTYLNAVNSGDKNVYFISSKEVV